MWCLFLTTLSYSESITNSLDLLQRVWTPISSLQNVYHSESYVNIGIYCMLYIYMKVYSYWYLFGYMVFSFVMRVRILWYFYIPVLPWRTDCEILTHIATPFTNCTEKSRFAEFTYRLQFVQRWTTKDWYVQIRYRCTQIYCCTHNLTFNTILVTNTYIIKQKNSKRNVSINTQFF